MKNKLLYAVIGLMVVLGAIAFLISQNQVKEEKLINEATRDDENPDDFDPSGLELDENTDSDAEIDRQLEALEKELDALDPNDFERSRSVKKYLLSPDLMI